MTNIKLINHTCVLIQDCDNFIITDPWFENPAFGSWLPNPATSVPPPYLVALSKTVKNFTIVISHGHDDHCDDKFLSLFPKDLNVVIPKYRSKGFYKRIENIGFKNIYECDCDGIDVGGFLISSFINSKISPDDSVMLIEGKNNLFVHANDNWQNVSDLDLFHKMKTIADKYPKDKKLFCSIVNIADGWPEIYDDYSVKEKETIINNRTKNIISSGIQNCKTLDCKYFLPYAGFATYFIKNKPIKKINKMFLNTPVDHEVEVLDMICGDQFNFRDIKRQFNGVRIPFDTIEDETNNFYKTYNKHIECDTYLANKQSIDIVKLDKQLETFCSSFKKFVIDRKQYKWNDEIFNFNIVFKNDNLNIQNSVVFSESKNLVTFNMDDNIFTKLLSGQINWENIYVGFQSRITVTPKDTNIRSVIRWLSRYGYTYQRIAKRHV